jgi:hypothetical protein
VSLLLWEGRSLTFVADQTGHSVATLAKHYAGVLEELEDKPRTLAADAIRTARNELRCAQPVRTAETDPTAAPPAKSPIPKWTMLGSNQRPPPCRGGNARSRLDRIGHEKPIYAGDSEACPDLRLQRDTAHFEPEGRTEDARTGVSTRLRDPARGRPRPTSLRRAWR